MAGKVNPMQGYQEATNQLLAINEQRKSNNAQAKMEETLQAAQNNTLAQASEFVATQSPQATVQPANLNPATQNILGQYGLGQPRMQKTTSSSSQQVTKQNITINNKNTTITNNNVSVPANIGGPVQGRPIQFQDPGQIKFKSWLSNSFAQQNEMAAKRQREYEKRDSALVRNSNKLMKRLEETGKSIATSLNPKNMASSMGNQLKTLLMVFGFAKLAKEWPNLMTWVNKISKEVSNIASDIKGFFSPDGGLAKMLGGKDGEGPLTALKNLFFDKNNGIFAYIRTWLSARMGERREAIKTLAKPDMSWNVGDGVGNNISRILGSVVGYLGDILSAIIDPTSAARNTVKATAEQAETEYQDNNQKTLRENRANVVITDENGRSVGIATSAGDQAIVEGRYQGVKPGSVDSQGNLTNNPISSIAQGNELMRAIDDSRRTGNLQTATVATGFARLHNAAQENGKVVLTEEFLSHYLGQEGIRELGLQKGNYRYIVRPKTREEMAMDLLSISRENEELRKWLTGIGMFAGGVLGGLGGNGIGKLVKEYKKRELPETVVELRPAGAEADYSKGERYVEGRNPQNLYEVTPEQLQKIIDKITGKENVNVDLNSADFMRAIESSLITQDTPLRVNRDIDIDQTYRVNDMVERNNAQLQTLRENSRANTAVNNTRETFSGLLDGARERFDNIFTFTGSSNINKEIPESKKSSGLFKGLAKGSKELKKKFVKVLRPEIVKKLKNEGKPEEFTDILLAQMATESAWGHNEAGAYNLSGIKALKNSDGTPKDPDHAALLQTFEYFKDNDRSKHKFPEIISIEQKSDGRYLWKVKDYFRTFDSLKDYLDYYVRLIDSKWRVFEGDGTVQDYVNRLGTDYGKGKYFTADPVKYANLVSTQIKEVRNIASELQNEYNTNPDAFLAESNFGNTSTLPEVEITAEDPNKYMPTYSPFNNNSNLGSSYSPYVSYSSNSSLSDNYPNAFSGSNGGNSDFSSISPVNPDYTSSLASMGADVKTMLGILRIMGQTDAQTLEATNNVVSAVGSLRSSGTAYTPSSPSFTDGHYNQSSIS